MIVMRKIVPALLLSVCASTAFGQSVGTLSASSTIYDSRANITLVDLGNPATAAGSVTTATVHWYAPSSVSSCTAAFKIKILRPAPSAGATYSVVADRGPFDAATTGFLTVPLSPAVAIQPGDYIAVTQLKPWDTCGAVLFDPAGSSHSLMVLNGEGSGSLNGARASRLSLMARASASTKVLEGVLAAAGSVQGANGSSFKTALQLTNYGLSPISGTLVFHPVGKPAAASDPSIDYSIGSARTISYDDVAAQMGASGLGSVDIISNASGAPIAAARIFNDLGTAGTSGFTEELITPDMALHVNETAGFAHPADTINYRMNIGVRTFGDGATINVYNYLAGGGFNASATHTYAPNYFEQVPLASFIAPGQVTPNGTLYVFVTQGSAVVYASTTDNRTNDSSIRFGVSP